MITTQETEYTGRAYYDRTSLDSFKSPHGYYTFGLGGLQAADQRRHGRKASGNGEGNGLLLTNFRVILYF